MENPTITTDLAELLNKFDRRFDKLEARFDKVDRQFDSIDGRLNKIDVKLENLDTRMSHVEKIVDKTADKQDAIVQDVSNLKGIKAFIIPIVVAVITSVLTLTIRAIPSP